MSVSTHNSTKSNFDLARQTLVAHDGGRKPLTVARLGDWEYLERSLHRMLCGWGRYMAEWEDKIALHRHVWEQAECVRRLRERLAQFPGSANNLDAPVSARLERLTNAVLLAPSHQDAVDGIYQILNNALTASYGRYTQNAHPVHDAPTIALLKEIVQIKEGHRLWLRDYRRRYPHRTDEDYSAAITRELQACDDLNAALPVEGERAAPVGVHTDFRLPASVARPAHTLIPAGRDFLPFVSADFPKSVEARRLFWCWGYLLEMTLPDQQLRWLYDAPDMPWEWHHDVSRHLWDESRHGDSGMSRFLDFGLSLRELGFPGEDNARLLLEGAVEPAAPQVETPGGIPAIGQAAPLSPAELYEAVFFIGMVAETGHFVVKRESYDDFRAGGDLESAEMMLFDIIDESAHVQYAHKWLPLLAERAGVDNENYKERAAQIRAARQEQHNAQLLQWADLPREASDPNYAWYQKLLAILREKQPLSNAQTCAIRSPRPM